MSNVNIPVHTGYGALVIR